MGIETPYFPGKQLCGHQGLPREGTTSAHGLWVQRWAPTSCVGSDKSLPLSELRVLKSKKETVLTPAVRWPGRGVCALCKILVPFQVDFSLNKGDARTGPRKIHEVDTPAQTTHKQRSRNSDCWIQAQSLRSSPPALKAMPTNSHTQWGCPPQNYLSQILHLQGVVFSALAW